MSRLKLHDMRICTVDHRSVHDRFPGIRLFLKDIHCQLHHFVAIGRINKSSIQHTVEHHFQSVAFAGESIDTDKNHFLLPSHFLCSLISSRSDTVIMRIHGVYLRMPTEHTIHFHFRRFTLPRSIRFINQFDIRKVTDSSHKSLMAFHGRS